MNVVCIIQARMGSTRLPGKVLMDLEGKPVLHRVIDRVLDAETVSKIVIATTVHERDHVIVDAVEGYHPRVSSFRGSEEDVLDRYYRAAAEARADLVVRVTSDCPLIDPEIIDLVVSALLRDPSMDYASNVLGELTYPRGLDVQAIRFSTLEKIWKTATEPEDREHVTLYLRKHPERFRATKIQLSPNMHAHRWTLDEPRDYELLTKMYARLYPVNPKFRMRDALALVEREPELAAINADVEQKLSQF
jgi:spore coat polysaccharide biosynthesis protein SpsF